MKRIASASFLALLVSASLCVPGVARHTEQGHTMQDAMPTIDWFIPLGEDRGGASWFIMLDDDGFPAEVVVYDGPCWFIVMETCSGGRVLMPEEMMAQWSWWSQQCNGLVACKGEEPYVWMEVTDWITPCKPVVAVRPRRRAADHPARRIPAPCDASMETPCGRVRIIDSDIPPDAPGPYVPPFQYDPTKLGCVCDPCDED